MHHARKITRTLLRFGAVWLVDAVSLLVAAALIPGIAIVSPAGSSPLVVAGAAALLLGLVNLLVRPLVLLLALPFGFIALFVVGFVVNAVFLMLTSSLMQGFVVGSWWDALAGSVVLAAVNTFVMGLIHAGDEDSFYQGVVERVATQRKYGDMDSDERGLVMMEIDGLSYHHVRHALERGYMPTVRQMMEEGHLLTRIDCGLPSQTSACQAGIMFGDNYDIPSFRWFDKETNRLIVSSRDAALLNERYANGQGLMSGGSSINNMLNGDAQDSILTLADLRTGTNEQKQRRAREIYLLVLNPYFLMRTVALFLADVLVELWEGFQQRRRGDEPRMSRLEHGYPVLRAATTVLMRDVAAYLTILHIKAGTPSLYTTWPGYDEVAHHSGPWSTDAFKVLAKYDRVIARVRDFIDRKAPRPYDLIVLSDHGQSQGWTFEQRYNQDLKAFIEERLPRGTSVVQTSGGDDGAPSVAAMSTELGSIKAEGVAGKPGSAVLGTAQQVLSQGVNASQAPDRDAPPEVVVCGSGNLAQVYFGLYPRKITLKEMNAAYPELVDALAAHEGIGFVVSYDDDGVPICIGKDGARNLHTGEIAGVDPLKPYGDVKLRAEQVRRVADFPHAGDLIVNSTLYPDGSVAAMEGLIGNHGGLGGEQTDAFILHPPDLQVPETKNSADLFAVLKGRRGTHAERKPRPRVTLAGVDAWAPDVLLAGLGRVREWGGRALRAMFLDREAYREVVRDAHMTGPAVLIAASAALVLSALESDAPLFLSFLGRMALWLLGVLLVFAGGRLMGGRGEFTMVLRALGFAQTAYFIDLLSLVPPVAPIARALAVVVAFFGSWMGSADAHELRGARTLLLPLLAVVAPIIGFLALVWLLGVPTTTLELGRAFGVVPR